MTRGGQFFISLGGQFLISPDTVLLACLSADWTVPTARVYATCSAFVRPGSHKVSTGTRISNEDYGPILWNRKTDRQNQTSTRRGSVRLRWPISINTSYRIY
ncbi:hypothetical protein GHK53_11355 [Sinorhizobium meliloti]|uniref:Uncharacterized protein n=1 Tax=Rhizobium meliloti TaxID=382 RepID=A0AAW9TKT1_RHIML|nr:hypothetical protein [Sinorhizobium meliloti]